MGRAPCCDKANVKKGPWSPEEDAKLKSYIEQHGTGGNWIALPQKIGLKRCGKSCRLRWLNYLRPNIKHGGFSEEEDNIICSLYVSIGSRWSVIAAQLPGRTDNDIKNYWNTRLKKKLLGKHRKEHQQQVRSNKGNCVVKQEIINNGGSSSIENRGISGKNVSSSITQQLQPYWPQMPPFASPPLQYYSNQICTTTPSFNDQDGIRKLLIKLGGRFSDNDSNNNDYQPILDGLNLQFQDGGATSCSLTDQVNNNNNNNNNNIGSSSINNNHHHHHQFCAEAGGIELVQGSFTEAIIGEMVNSSLHNYAPSHNKFGGLELLYGEEMITDKIIMGATSNWGETSSMSSMIYSPLNVASCYDGVRQDTPPQVCAFQELNFPGPPQ